MTISSCPQKKYSIDKYVDTCIDTQLEANLQAGTYRPVTDAKNRNEDVTLNL